MLRIQYTDMDYGEEKIVQTLLENPGGIRPEELRITCGINKKPFYARIKRLRNKGTIKKKPINNKDGKSYFVYTITIGSDIKFIQEFIKITYTFHATTGEKLSQNKEEEMWRKIPKGNRINLGILKFQELKDLYQRLLVEYFKSKKGKILYKAGLKIVEERAETITKILTKILDKEEKTLFHENLSTIGNMHRHHTHSLEEITRMFTKKPLALWNWSALFEMGLNQYDFPNIETWVRHAGPEYLTKLRRKKDPRDFRPPSLRTKNKKKAEKLETMEAEYYRTILKLGVIQSALAQGKTSLEETLVVDKYSADKFGGKTVVFSKHPNYDWLMGKIPLVDGYKNAVTMDEEYWKKVRAAGEELAQGGLENWDVLEKMEKSVEKMANDFIKN